MNHNPFDEITERLVRIEIALDHLLKERNEQDFPKAISSKQAAEELNISLAHLYRLTMNKELPFKKLKGKLLFYRDQLQEFINKNGKL